MECWIDSAPTVSLKLANLRVLIRLIRARIRCVLHEFLNDSLLSDKSRAYVSILHPRAASGFGSAQKL